jgi:hypothetical protein
MPARGTVVLVAIAGLCMGCGGHRKQAPPTHPGVKWGGLVWVPAPPTTPARRVRPGDWPRYVLTPTNRSVCAPRAAYPLASTARNANALTCGGRGAATLSGNDPRLVLDFGREMSGGLRLTVAGAVVHVAFSESLTYLSKGCDRLSTEPFEKNASFPIESCPRTAAPGDHVTAPRSGFRYVLLWSDRPATVTGVRVANWEPIPQARDLRARALYKGWFESSDSGLNRIWFDGVYNAQVNTVAAGRAGIYFEGLPGLSPHETVMVDGAKRDRYIWYDLAGPKTLLPLLYGDTDTPRNTLAALAKQQLPNGFIPGCRTPRGFYGASCQVPTWTDATAWWVIALGEYVDWTGDLTFARHSFPTVVRALRALDSCRRPGGLLVPCFGAFTYIYGGSDADNDPTETTYLNSIAAGAQGTAARLAALLGRDPGPYRTRRAALVRRINARLWDGHAKAFRQSTGRAGQHPQDANVLPVFFGLTSRARGRAALDYVRRNLWTAHGTRSGVAGHNFGQPVSGMVADWISWFEITDRLTLGQTTQARAMLDRGWGWMHLRSKPIRGLLGSTIEPASATGWEHVLSDGSIFRGSEGSLAHVWSEGAPIALTTGFLGVTPQAPGFRRWRIAPHADGSRLRWARGRLPTRFGPLTVTWRLRHGRVRLVVDAPPGTTGTVVVNGRRFDGVSGRRAF